MYPISSQGGEIAGQKVYKKLRDVPGPVDLISIAVPAPAVPGVLRECLEPRFIRRALQRPEMIRVRPFRRKFPTSPGKVSESWVLIVSVSTVRRGASPCFRDLIIRRNRARLIENIEVESAFRTVSRQYQEAQIPVYTEPERALRGIRNAARMAQRG